MGTDDLIVWRPTNGRWYARDANGTQLVNFVQWGRFFDTPVVGDFDNDGKADFGIWRPHKKQWFAKAADNTVLFTNVGLGGHSDTPLFMTLTQ